jgi:hypothetical protein
VFASLSDMNPDYLWLTGALEVLTLFAVAPVLGLAISYAAWRGKPQMLNPARYGADRVLCVTSGVTAVLLLVFAQLLNADVRTPQYLLQLVCFLFGSLLFGVSMGCCFSVLLRASRWHKATRLPENSKTER